MVRTSMSISFVLCLWKSFLFRLFGAIAAQVWHIGWYPTSNSFLQDILLREQRFFVKIKEKHLGGKVYDLQSVFR